MEEGTEFKKYTYFGYIILCTLSVASCFSSLFGGFVFDDTEVILNNEDILPETPIKNIFLHDYWGSSLKHNLSHKSYRPLTILTFRLNYILFGGFKAWSFHLVNVLLHVTISLLSWSVFTEILGLERADYAVFASILFALHPVHSEAVCGIVGRADLLAALFFFLSFLAFGRALSRRTNNIRWFFASVALGAISMFCKEQGVTVLGFLCIYDILKRYRIDVSKFMKPWKYIPRMMAAPGFGFFIFRQVILIISAISLVYFRFYLMDFQSPPFQVSDNPASFEKDWTTRVLSYNYIFCLNFWLLFCPEWLCFDWSMGCVPVVKINDRRAGFVFFLWFALIVTVWRALASKKGTKQRDILIALSLIVIPFLPASNLFFRVGFVLAERVLYIPSAGYCVFVVLGMEVLVERYPSRKRDITFAFSMLIMLFLLRSNERSTNWVSEQSLFNTGLKVCPRNAKVHYNVAIAALSRGNATEAVLEYKEAIRLYPDYYQAYNNLANILKNQGNLDGAEGLLEKALSINEDFPAAWMNLGVVLAQKRNFRKAEKSYLNALKYRKNYPDCHYNLGKLYLEENRLADAEKSWRTAISLKPSFTVAWNNLIILITQRGNYHDAAVLAREALSILGNEPGIHFNLANALGKLGEFPEAETHFIKAIKLKKDNPQYFVNLGVLYHRWKKYKKAEECYQKALKLDPTFKAARENYSLLKRSLKGGKKG